MDEEQDIAFQPAGEGAGGFPGDGGVAVSAFRLHVLIFLLAVLPGGASAREPLPARKPVPRADRFGDPLPEGAIARLGSKRLMHAGSVMRVGLSRDASRIISEGDDYTVCVWDANSGKLLASLQLPEPDFVAVSKELSGKKLDHHAFSRHYLRIGRIAAISPDAKEVAIRETSRVAV